MLVDDDVVVTESGATLIYLAEKTGKLLQGAQGASRIIEMVINQMAVARADDLLVSGVPWPLAEQGA